jgi:hypothetical protein
MRLRVDDYQIEAELIHTKSSLRVKFTAIEDLNVAMFELHNGRALPRCATWRRR